MSKKEIFNQYPDPFGKYSIDVCNIGQKSIYIYYIDYDIDDVIYYKVIVNIIDKKPKTISTHKKKIFHNTIGAYFNHDGYRIYLKDCYKVGGPWGIA